MSHLQREVVRLKRLRRVVACYRRHPQPFRTQTEGGHPMEEAFRLMTEGLIQMQQAVPQWEEASQLKMQELRRRDPWELQRSWWAEEHRPNSPKGQPEGQQREERQKAGAFPLQEEVHR
jgi:hypothetical protein